MKHKKITFILIAAIFVFAPLYAQAQTTTKRKYKAKAVRKTNAVSFQRWKKTELYFGANKPDGTEVTEQEFKRFVDQEVTPKFPDGLTVFFGYGQYRNSSDVIVKEKSMILVLLYPLNMKGGGNIQAIRAAYKKIFNQESVLRADSFVFVSF